MEGEGFHPHLPKMVGAWDEEPAVSVRPTQSHWHPGSTACSPCGRTPGLEAVGRPGEAGIKEMASLCFRHTVSSHSVTFSPQSPKCNCCSCLFIGLGAAEAKDEQMAMGVRAGETLTIRSEFAVKNSSVTLAFNLDGKKMGRWGEWVQETHRKRRSFNHSTYLCWCWPSTYQVKKE